MSLVGNLEDLSLPDILQIVSLSKKSGILQVEREGQQGKIYIRQGKVIQTLSPRAGKTLGEILVGKGLLKPDDLKSALETQRAGSGRELLGAILVRLNLLDEQTIEKVVREQIEDAIVFFLSWKEGTFSFELADIEARGEFSVDPQAFILERGIDTQWLVLEGTRLIDERAREKGKAPPVEERSDASGETSFADLEAPEQEERSLVLVDDDQGFSDLAKEHFSRLGFTVVLCDSVAAGLRAADDLVRQMPPPVLVADIVMPTSDNQGFLGGLELIEKIRQAHPEIAVTAVTAYPDDNVKTRVGELGARFVLKPGGGPGPAMQEFFEQIAAGFAGEELAAPAPPPVAVPAPAPQEAPQAPTPEPPAPPPAPEAPVAAAAPAPPPVVEAPVAPPPPPAPETPPPAARPSERDRTLEILRKTKEALARQEETVSAAGLGEHELPLLRDMLLELQNPRATGEIGLLVLRFAAEIMNRAVLFVVKGGKAHGLGGFGVEVSGTELKKGVRGIAVPLDQPSVLEDVVTRRAMFHGPVPSTPWNGTLLDQLGGKTPSEAVALPLLSGGKVRVLLYGDNLPEQKPISGVRALQIFLTQAGLTLERVLLEKKLQEIDGAAEARREQKGGVTG